MSSTPVPSDRVAALRARLAAFPSLLVGYSGGVDSAVVAVLARQALGRDRSVAALGRSPSVSRVQLEQARDIAEQFDLRFVTIDTHEFEDAEYAANSTERCFFCKRELWVRLSAFARDEGLAAMADGTNADDLGEHRPGLRATEGCGVVSPLAGAGFTKPAVRAVARELGIPIWNAPSAPCLASRVMYGLAVTGSRVRQVEEGEALLRAIGVDGDLRVRHRGDEARIEVPPSSFALVRRHRDDIGARLLDLGFRSVTLDLAGYQRGSQLTGGATSVEVLAGEG